VSAAEYSVCQFFEDDSYVYELRRVTLERAVKNAEHLSSSVGAKLGMTKRVIITDGGDSIVYEWQYGKGLVFPTPEHVAEAKAMDAKLEAMKKKK
jgi:hypothetical protein